MKIKKDDTVILKSGMAATVLEVRLDSLLISKTTGKEVIVGLLEAGGLTVGLDDVEAVVTYTQHSNPLLQAIIDHTPAHENRLLVVRPEARDTIAALITFKSVGAMNKGQAVAVIRNAVTRWMVQTFEGIKAWAESSEDFNIGDLSSHLGDRRLISLLEAFGVHQLTVEQLDLSSDEGHWNYDTVLAHADNAELRAKLVAREAIPPTKLSDPAAEKPEDLENLSWDSGRKEEPGAQA